MIWALIITGYLVVAAGTAVVVAYQDRLEHRLAEREHDWGDIAPPVIAIGMLWPFVLVFLAVAEALAFIGRLIDDAVQAKVEDRAREDSDG